MRASAFEEKPTDSGFARGSGSAALAAIVRFSPSRATAQCKAYCRFIFPPLLFIRSAHVNRRTAIASCVPRRARDQAIVRETSQPLVRRILERIVQCKHQAPRRSFPPEPFLDVSGRARA